MCTRYAMKYIIVIISTPINNQLKLNKNKPIQLKCTPFETQSLITTIDPSRQLTTSENAEWQTVRGHCLNNYRIHLIYTHILYTESFPSWASWRCRSSDLASHTSIAIHGVFGWYVAMLRCPFRRSSALLAWSSRPNSRFYHFKVWISWSKLSPKL